MANFVICYDIVEDKQRNQVVTLLQDMGGVRVQYSVFELRLAQNKMRELLEKLAALISSKQDSIIAYELCTACQSKTVRQGRRYAIPEESVVTV